MRFILKSLSCWCMWQDKLSISLNILHFFSIIIHILPSLTLDYLYWHATDIDSVFSDLRNGVISNKDKLYLHCVKRDELLLKRRKRICMRYEFKIPGWKVWLESTPPPNSKILMEKSSLTFDITGHYSRLICSKYSVRATSSYVIKNVLNEKIFYLYRKKIVPLRAAYWFKRLDFPVDFTTYFHVLCIFTNIYSYCIYHIPSSSTEVNFPSKSCFSILLN